MASLPKDQKENANKTLMKSNENVASSSSKLSTELEQLLSDNFDNKSLQKIKEIYEKTQSMKEEKKVNDREVQENFNTVRTRLNQSSQCLNRIKKELENINFSYSKNVLNIHNSLKPGDYFDPAKNPIRTRAEMEKKMEDIQVRIDEIQKEIKEKREKHASVTQNFQKAFDDVVYRLQAIDKGEYSSDKQKVKENEEEMQ